MECRVENKVKPVRSKASKRGKLFLSLVVLSPRQNYPTGRRRVQASCHLEVKKGKSGRRRPRPLQGNFVPSGSASNLSCSALQMAAVCHHKRGSSQRVILSFDPELQTPRHAKSIMIMPASGCPFPPVVVGLRIRALEYGTNDRRVKFRDLTSS
jgi:hypothetical protein